METLIEKLNCITAAWKAQFEPSPREDEGWDQYLKTPPDLPLVWKVEDGILFLNPGAIRGCRDTGRPSYCLMVLGDDGKIHVRKKEFR